MTKSLTVVHDHEESATKKRIGQEERQEFAGRLLEAIDKAGTTQTQLAKHLGLSRSAVNFWCQGVTYPSIPLVATVAAFLRTTPEYLLYGAVKVPKERLSQSVPVMAHTSGRDTIITRLAMPNEFLAHANMMDTSKLKAWVITGENLVNGLTKGDIVIADVTDKELTRKSRMMVIDNGDQTAIGRVRLSRKDHVEITIGEQKPFEMPLSKSLIVGKPVAALSANFLN